MSPYNICLRTTVPKHILLLLMFVCGCLYALSFAPFNSELAIFVSLAGLFAGLLQSQNARAAMWVAFSYGLGFALVGIHWLYISIRVYGQVPMLFSLLITLGFIIAVAVLFVPFAAIAPLLFVRLPLLAHPIAFACLWSGFEWFHGTQLSGFPWLLAAYSQTDGPLKNLVPWISDYGLGWLLAWLSACLLHVLLVSSWRYRLIVLISTGAILLATATVKNDSLSIAQGAPLEVALVQGNIPQSVKWDRNFYQLSLKTYRAQTLEHLESRIIVWPEAAIPMLLEDLQPWLAKFKPHLHKHQSELLLGIPSLASEIDSYHNSALVITAESKTNSPLYHKIHLLPFGDYVPFEEPLGPIFKIFNIPMARTRPGVHHQSLLQLQNHPIGVFICYEVAFKELIADTLPTAHMLVTLTNDAWFNNSIGADQHFQIGRYRALQAQRDMLFVANDGYTAIINHDGKVAKIAPRFTTTTLLGTVQPRIGARAPAFWQGWDPLLFLIAVLIIILALARSARPNFGRQNNVCERC